MEKKEIDKLAHLARLALTEQEKSALVDDLDKIIGLIDSMNSIDTENITPLAHPHASGQRLREDVVTESDHREKLLALAPQHDQGLFIVPEVIE